MPHGRQEFIAVAPASTVRMADLAQALLYEANVIDELRQALLRQRAGVAADDAEQVEASIHAMGRTLLTLEEARRRRGAARRAGCVELAPRDRGSHHHLHGHRSLSLAESWPRRGRVDPISEVAEASRPG